MKKNQFTPPVAKVLIVFMLAFVMLSLVQTSYACDMFAAISKNRIPLHSVSNMAILTRDMLTKLKATANSNPNGCGFGFYYDNPQDLSIERDDISIANSAVYNYVFNEIIHPQSTPVYALMAHARFATSGPSGGVHPFRWNSRLGDNKVYTLMHNGSVSVSSLRTLLNNVGFSDTWIKNAYKECHNVSIAPGPLEMVDSELMFYLIMGMTERYRDIYKGLYQALYLIKSNTTYTSLNFILSDGTSIYSFKKVNSGNNKLYYSNIPTSIPMFLIKTMTTDFPTSYTPSNGTELQNDQLLIYHQGDNAPTIINNFAITEGELTDLYTGMDWRSFPVMEDDVVVASTYFESIPHYNFYDIHTVEEGYNYYQLHDLDIRRDAGYIITMQNPVDNFLMKGTLTDKDYPVQLTAGENWIGYFLRSSYSPLVVLSPVLNNINRIEARKWYMYRGKFGEWIGAVQQGASVSMNYGEMYKIHYYGPSTSFSYSYIGTPLARFSPEDTSYYTFSESPSYLAAAIYDPGWDAMPDELAILINGTVVGASVVSEYPVLIRVYTEDLNDIVIETCYSAKSGSAERKVLKNSDLEIKRSDSGVYEILGKNPTEDLEDHSPELIRGIIVHPNPLTTWSRISVDTNHKGSVRMNIYNLKGQRVKTFRHEMKSAGTHSVLWDGKDSSGNRLASGIYFLNVSIGSESRSQKVMLIN